MKTLILSVVLLCVWCVAWAQQPLYIVNGRLMDDISSISPNEIERVEELPITEEVIAKYGHRANYGVHIITLTYDKRAQFSDSLDFDAYIARSVVWAEDEPVARVVLRYRVEADGSIRITEELESTDNRLKRRVLKSVEGAPKFTPAMKSGEPVASEGVLYVQLPEGRAMPRKPELVYR